AVDCRRAAFPFPRAARTGNNEKGMNSVPCEESWRKKVPSWGKGLPSMVGTLFHTAGKDFFEIEQFHLQSVGWSPARTLAAGVIIAAYLLVLPGTREYFCVRAPGFPGSGSGILM
ncbi:MAG: hypothetical protein WBB46_11655, partial [Candidatus Deferrimicrobiaceae bacterium]